MIPELIKLFNCVAVKPGEHLFNAEMVNKISARCGYLVHPDACTADALKFFQDRVDNYNTTFYSSWKDVDSLEEADMRVLQLLHYLSTYGTDYEGPVFTMNDFPPEMRFTEFKILMPCTERELFDRILKMLESGIALSTDTLKLILEQAFLYSDRYGWEIDPEKIENREARAEYYLHTNIFPYEPFELMRVFMMVCRKNALLINDGKTRKGIEAHIREVIDIFSFLDERHLRSLSTIFYRYKKLFLLMRKYARNISTEMAKDFVAKINTIRRLARKYHKPLEMGVLQNILNPLYTEDEVAEAIRSCQSAFVLIRLLNYLNSEQKDFQTRTFNIRNGKIWVGLRKKSPDVTAERIESFIKITFERIAELLKSKSVKEDGSAVTVRFPEHLELAAPVSEKLFVGSVPYGSRFRLRTNNYIGVYWRNEWGTYDYDLWVVEDNGQRIGWNNDHKDDNILFSGDMTTANPEATEIMYCRGKWPDCTIRVNRYNGRPGSRFRIFFGADDLKELPLSYMVNPDSIQFSEDLYSETAETTIGVVYDNMVYIAAMGSGNLLLPKLYDSKTVSYERAFFNHFSTYMALKDILLASGFKEYAEESESQPDIDLSKELSKDTLISLLTV